MKNWEFAVESIEKIKEKGQYGCDYHILINGINSYTGETKADYIKKGYAVLTESEFDEAIKEYEKSICGHWMEISEKFYNQQLNVLPPMKWYNGGFFVSEAMTGSIHGFYQELNGKYYESLQDIFTKREDIIADLKKAIAENRIEDRTKDDEEEE